MEARKLGVGVWPGYRAKAGPEEEGVSQVGAPLPQQNDKRLAAAAYFLLCGERGSEGWSQPYRHLLSPKVPPVLLAVLPDPLACPFLPRPRWILGGLGRKQLK